MINQIKKYLKILGLFLFVYILFKINLRELFLTLNSINFIYFFLALLLWFFTFVLKVLKWKTLVDSQNIEISFNNLFKISLKGLYLGIITPGKLGEFWRAKYLVEISPISYGKAFYTTLMDRIMELVIIVPLSLASIFILFLFYEIEIGLIAISSILVFSFLTLYFLIKRKSVKEFLKYLIRVFLPQSWEEKTNSFLNDFFEELEKLNPFLFLKLLGYGLGYYLVAILVYYFIILSLGLNVPFWFLFLIVALVWLILILPITILGLGTRDASYIFFFSIFGIASSQAVAIALLVLFCNIIIAIPGAILFLKK